MGAFKTIEREELHKLDECEATKVIDENGRTAPWREALRKAIKAKDRANIERCQMNELDPEYRSHSRKEEVNQGLTKEQAVTEAQRCLDCANPGCMTGCPVGIDIPRFIKNIERGEFLEAAKTLKETSALPAVCGRVCPQEKQCESKCIHLKMGKEAVAIGHLERFAADYERESGQISVPEVGEKNGIKVAVIGSGPAGLSFAGDMAKYGYDVTVFEALHEINLKAAKFKCRKEVLLSPDELFIHLLYKASVHPTQERLKILYSVITIAKNVNQSQSLLQWVLFC